MCLDAVDVPVRAVGKRVLAGVDFLDADGLPGERHRAAHALAAVSERLIGVGHVERGHADRKPADGHGGVRRERGRDPHPVRKAGDPGGADFEADFGVDRVVREGRRARQGVRPRVGPFVVVDHELFGAPGVRDDEGLLLGGPNRVGGDAVLERGRQVEGLERGARLALALGREVERAFVVSAPSDHRADLTRGVFDRHQRGRRATGVGQVVVDGLFGRALQFEVQCGADLQAAVEGPGGAVAFDDLLLDPAREVTGVDPFDGLLLRRLNLVGGGQRLLDRFLIDRLGQIALVEHLAQDDIAPFQGRQRMEGRVIGGGGLDDARQQGRLPRRQLFDTEFVSRHAAAEVVDVVAEVGLGGSLDPVGAAAEVDRVQVGRDDLVLRPLV